MAVFQCWLVVIQGQSYPYCPVEESSHGTSLQLLRLQKLDMLAQFMPGNPKYAPGTFELVSSAFGFVWKLKEGWQLSVSI